MSFMLQKHKKGEEERTMHGKMYCCLSFLGFGTNMAATNKWEMLQNAETFENLSKGGQSEGDYTQWVLFGLVPSCPLHL